jgi:hypothetical protein
MKNTEITKMLLALRIAFIGALIVLPIAVVAMDAKTATISIGLLVASAFAYTSLQKEMK